MKEKEEKICQRCHKVVDKLYFHLDGNFCEKCYEEVGHFDI